MRILILGLNTRDIGQAAVRGGYNLFTLDYFGDRDQKELVENYSLMRDFKLDFGASNLLICSRHLDFEALVYVSNLENHFEVVQELAEGHTLLGNTPQTLRKVRDWRTFRSFCHQERIPFPFTLFCDEPLPKQGHWLRKPLRSGGGHDITFWQGELPDESYVLQEYIDGIHCSAAFVADSQKCVVIGITEQLIGRKELGGSEFVWCGNILPLALSPRETDSVLDAVKDIATKLTRSFGLRGVNGFDFVLTRPLQGQGISYLIEVNPRYTASMELIERAYGLSVFSLHIRSFEGELPPFALREQFPPSHFYGKGVVYARCNVMMPETAEWKKRERRDIPFAGEQIRARHPICTVLAQGVTREDCWQNLAAAAEATYQEVELAHTRDIHPHHWPNLETGLGSAHR
ncbi:MAG: ATP-grasp domain-containing protein [Chloroflexi bacterium]|nr:ATP-grasp domain-containing protein [Chloroflexota bacterium]